MKRIISLVILILFCSSMSWAYITAEEAKKVSVGDTVYIKAFGYFDGNGIIKSRTGDMVIIAIKDLQGRDVNLNIHWGWISVIVNDVPEVVNDVDALKQQIKDLQIENSNLKSKIQVLEAYISKLKVKISELCELIN